jgi:hypothetical protein
MKKLFFIALFMASQANWAQEVTRNLGDFSTIRVFDQINVTLVAADENKIVIKGSKANDVELVTKNDELKIRMGIDNLLEGEDVEATLYYKKIFVVEASEGSFVGSADVFKATAFEVNAKEGANVKLKLDVQKLDVTVSSGGIAELSGTAQNQDVIVLAGGILKAKELVTAQTDVTVNAGGEAAIFATDFIKAKTRAGGRIDVYGNPKQIDQQTVLGGAINIHD